MHPCLIGKLLFFVSLLAFCEQTKKPGDIVYQVCEGCCFQVLGGSRLDEGIVDHTQSVLKLLLVLL